MIRYYQNERKENELHERTDVQVVQLREESQFKCTWRRQMELRAVHELASARDKVNEACFIGRARTGEVNPQASSHAFLDFNAS